MEISASFASVNNLTLPLAQSAAGATVRVASLSSGILGSLAVTGTTEATWGLSQNPSWVTLTTNPNNPLQATLSFTNAPAQALPYQFYVVCAGVSGSSYYPISVEVLEPFTIQALGGGTAFSVPSYDSTVTDIVLQGIGLDGVVDAGVKFMIPASLPAGLLAITSDESSMHLRVLDSTGTNVPGGLALNTGSPTSVQITIQAYKPGTMYDTPARCFTQVFTIESLLQKAGILDIALAVSYNTVTNTINANAYVDYLQGVGGTVTYEWDITGVAGTTSSGGGASDKFLIWAPTASGTATITFKVKNAAGTILAQKAVTGITCSPSQPWTTTGAIKISVDAPVKTGYAGGTASFTVSTPAAEFNGGETITVTMAIAAASAVEGTATLSTSTVALTTSVNSHTVNVTLPSSGWNEKWNVTLTAANASVSPTRTGAGQIVIESNGASPLTVGTGGVTTASAVAGVSITPIALTAENLSSSLVAATFELRGAPDGLYVNEDSIVGTVLTPGTYTIHAIATATGYARSISTAITLTVTSAFAPLAIGALSPSVSSLPDGQPFIVQWSTTGEEANLTLVQGINSQGVTGASQATLSQIGNSVINLIGTSFYGNAYTAPIIVLSSSITSQGRLLNSPTIGVIDENFKLQLNWNPASVDGGYSVYKGWNITLTLLPDGSPTLQYINGAIPTGLEVAGSTADSRIFVSQLVSGDYTVDMQALSADYSVALDATSWDAAHEFPTQITEASVTFDNSTIDLGQTVNISLDPAYVGANSWQVNFPDNTSTGWIPLSIKTVSKTFATAGIQSIVIQTQNNFSSATPGVRLIRQVTKTLFVMNQQYSGTTTSTIVVGSEGFGGEAGFEITNNLAGTASIEPFMVITRTLVRDTVTNELKVMVATSRNEDSSSVYGTMALDVFPLVGRPRVQDLIAIPDVLITGTQVSINPVAISTTTLPNFIVGKAISDFVMQTTSGSGTAPFSWYTDDLPAGLSMSIDGTLTGTPQVLFSGTVRFSVTDSSNPPFIAETVLPVVVASDLAITTTSIPGAFVATPYAFEVQNTGGLAPYTWALVSGSLPKGLVIDPNSGIISGVPVTYNSTTDFAKTYTATIQVTDSIGAIASVVISTTLSPAALQFGLLDQPNIFAGSDFRMTVPIFGGASPYTLASFTDDGVVGSGLSILNPTKLAALAGIASSALSIVTGNQAFYPQTYPAGIEVELSATNGVAPYRYMLGAGSSGAINAVIYGDTLVAFPTADGNYNLNIQCIDSVGHSVTKTITLSTQQKNSGVYTIKPVSVAQNGSTNPANWTVTPISALPDAAAGAAYTPAAGSYYGLALYQNNVLHMTQNSGTGTPMSFALHSGTLPTNIVAVSGNGFGAMIDYSGIVLFNPFGGAFPSTLGSSSFEAEFSNIETSNGVITQTVARESITVVVSVGSTTPVVVTIVDTNITLSAATVSGTSYAWYLPLVAEGGTGPYTFAIQSSSTLPGALVSIQNGIPTLTANNIPLGSFTAVIKATDANGVQSAAATVTVTVTANTTQATHIVATNLPAYVYENQMIVANTYFFESDEISSWTATGLPAGVTLSSLPGTKAYLQGTSTQSGTFTVVVQAISTIYGTSVSGSYTLLVKPQSAVLINKPSTATVGVQYSVVNNNAILTVQYTGYQPGAAGLPLLTAISGTVGAPGTLVNGLPTTAIRSITADGFTMDYNYTNNTVGTDIVTLGSSLDSCSIAVSQPVLVLTPSTIAATVSEYATSASFSAPVSVSGGLAPYTILCTGFSDSRFSAVGSGVQISPNQFAAGQTYPCAVAVTVTDSGGQTATVIGTLDITIRKETYDTVKFANQTWAVTVSGDTPFTASLAPNQLGSIPELGHAPYQYYVDSVTLPGGLGSFVVVSPSKRVLAIQFNETSTSASVSDLGATLGAFGTFVVPAVNLASAPATGTYTIAVALRVVDSESIVSSQTVDVLLTIS